MKLPRSLFALTAVAVLPLLAPAQSTTPQNTVIESDGPGEMVSADKETTFTFHDNVRVTGTNIKLTCDYLKVVVVRMGDPSATIGKVDKFRSLLATGNVHIVQLDREAACGRAEVLPEEDKIVLTETPVIVSHNPESRGSGKKITMHTGQRRVEIEEPVITGPAIKDLGFDKEPKPASPAPLPVPVPAEVPKQP